MWQRYSTKLARRTCPRCWMQVEHLARSRCSGASTSSRSLWSRSSPGAEAVPIASSDLAPIAMQDGELNKNLLNNLNMEQLPEASIALLTSPSFFEPLSNLFLAIPPLLGISYALSIPLLTLCLRVITFTPLTLWQRRRTRKMMDVVIPEARAASVAIAQSTRAECRQAGKSYEEFQLIYKAKVKANGLLLARKHGVNPRLTVLLPPLVNAPIFIATTLALRDACMRASESISHPQSTLELYGAPNFAQLQELATTFFMWCPSMITPDGSMILPVAVGLVVLTNVEVTAKARKINLKNSEDSDDASTVANIERQRSSSIPKAAQSINPSPPYSLGRGRDRSSLVSSTPKRRLSVLPTPVDRSVDREQEIRSEEPKEPNFNRILTGVLRVTAVAFIPIAAMAPSAVCGYWLTSNLYALAQHLILASSDSRRKAAAVRGVKSRKL